MNHFHISPTLHHFSNIFFRNGFNCYLVGGALRNHFAGLKPTDFDFATDATPEEVIKIFQHVIPTGIKHGTVTVIFEKYKFEVTTFRIESNYSNSRHPNRINFNASIYQDLKRRDFTINSIAMNLQTKELLDPHNGIQDLKHHLIKAIDDPVERFTEDGLRVMRACRFTAQLNFTIEINTFLALKECRYNLRNISAERIRDEILKILKSKKPSIAFKIMEELGILELIIPELAKCRGVTQKEYLDSDVLDHLYYSCDRGPANDSLLRLACLLHDTGKSLQLYKNETDFSTSYYHNSFSKKIAVEIMQRLKFSKKETKRVAHLISNCIFYYSDDWTNADIRRFISKVGIDSIDDLFKLRIANLSGIPNSSKNSKLLEKFADRISIILEKENVFSIRGLAISGSDLQIEAGFKKGPFIGTVLQKLLEIVLNNPSLNNRQELLKIASKLNKTYQEN